MSEYVPYPSPRVTVFVPVFNAESYIAHTIQSVLDQTYQDFELLLIDDGSTDSSVDVAKSFVDERIRLLQNNQNRGRPFTRNRGVKEARGEFISVLDSDDLCEPDRLTKQIEYLDLHPNIAAVGSWAHYIDDQGNTFLTCELPTEPEEIHKQIFLRNCFVHSSVTFRRSVLIDLGGYNADFPQAQDYELFLRLSGHYKLSNLPEPLVRYRVHPNQVSLQKMASQRRLADKARAQAYKDQVNLGIAPHNAIKPDINYLSSLRGNAGTIGSDCFNWIDIYRTLNIKSTTNKLIIKSLLASPLSPRAWDEAIHLAKSVIFPQTIQNRLRWYKNKIFSMFPLRRK